MKSLKEGKKIFVISAYATIGAGQNMAYDRANSGRESKHTAGGLSMPARVASDAFYGALYSA